MSQQINLVNPLLLKKRYAFGLREMAYGVGFALVLALAWSAWLYSRAVAAEARATGREAQQAEAEQTFDMQAAAAARPPSKLLAERARAAGVRVAEREALLASLGTAGSEAATGFASRMRALAHGRVDGVWLNAFTLAPDYVFLEGSTLEAARLSAYLEQLGRQAPFAGVSFSAVQAAPARADAGAAGHVGFTLVAGARPGKTEGAADER